MNDTIKVIAFYTNELSFWIFFSWDPSNSSSKNILSTCYVAYIMLDTETKSQILPFNNSSVLQGKVRENKAQWEFGRESCYFIC